MIKYYQRTAKDHKLKKIKDFQKGSLIYISDPNEIEIELISQKFDLEDGLIFDALDPYESPRMEIKNKIVYIFVRLPEQKGSIRQISTFPIMFAVHKNFLMIVSKENPESLISMLEKNNDYQTTESTQLFLRIFFEIEDIYNSFLNKINKRINYFSLNVGNFKDQDIVNFVGYEVMLNEFINALLPLRHVLSNIISGKSLDLYEDDHELIEDLQLNNDQLIERSKSNLTNIVNIRQAHEVISTNRLNRVMKVLTVSTVILALPTMITSFYGMNVRLPFANSFTAYWGIIISIFASIGILLIFLRRKRII
jgi:magnesium transporter